MAGLCPVSFSLKRHRFLTGVHTELSQILTKRTVLGNLALQCFSLCTKEVRAHEAFGRFGRKFVF
jgi:hypothetical protein